MRPSAASLRSGYFEFLQALASGQSNIELFLRRALGSGARLKGADIGLRHTPSIFRAIKLMQQCFVTTALLATSVQITLG